MANHIQGQGRHQVTLLPDALDDFVTEDNLSKFNQFITGRWHIEIINYCRFVAVVMKHLQRVA